MKTLDIIQRIIDLQYIDNPLIECKVLIPLFIIL